jgi:hypothetical protein
MHGGAVILHASDVQCVIPYRGAMVVFGQFRQAIKMLKPSIVS